MRRIDLRNAYTWILKKLTLLKKDRQKIAAACPLRWQKSHPSRKTCNSAIRPFIYLSCEDTVEVLSLLYPFLATE
jgi:hypothetical protein